MRRENGSLQGEQGERAIPVIPEPPEHRANEVLKAIREIKAKLGTRERPGHRANKVRKEDGRDAFQGIYSSQTYSIGEFVIYRGRPYWSLSNDNYGTSPGSESDRLLDLLAP